MLVYANLTALLGFLELIMIEQKLFGMLANITATAWGERAYHTIVYASSKTRHDETYAVDGLLRTLSKNGSMPILRLHGEGSAPTTSLHNRELLTLAQLDSNEAQDQLLLWQLWQHLPQNRQSRLLLLLDAHVSDAYVERMLKFCVANKAMNVMAVNATVMQNGQYYAMQIFPELRLQHGTLWKAGNKLFPNHVGNMHGAALQVISKYMEPKCFAFQDAAGRNITSGTVCNVFVEYARKHNATLVFPVLKDVNAKFSLQLNKFLENNTYDMSSEVASQDPKLKLSYTGMLLNEDWCVMVPVEQPVPSYLFYVIVFDGLTLLLVVLAWLQISCALGMALRLKGRQVRCLDFFCNLNLLNGFVGQSFKIESRFAGIRSCLYLIVCVSGILFNTTYVAYLQSYMACAPIGARVNSMDDMKSAGLVVLAYGNELGMLQKVHGMHSALKNATSYRQFYDLRNSFNTRYAYPVGSAMWLFYLEEQKFFYKPLFRFSEICVVKDYPMTLPLQENSIHQPSLSYFIEQLKQVGLLDHWKTSTYLELVRLGRVRIRDLSVQRDFIPMKLKDLYLMMILFGVAIFLACCCFLLELVWFKRRRSQQVRASAWSLERS